MDLASAKGGEFRCALKMTLLAFGRPLMEGFLRDLRGISASVGMV
jgi:hypothetical protein